MSEFEPINEGVDHINIYSKSRTVLGRQLSNFQKSPFNHPKDGKFMSVEGYWYWYLTGQDVDDFRQLFGFKAKELGKKILEERKINKDQMLLGFQEDVLEAIRCKLRQNRYILMNLISTDLPLEHYYFYGKIDNCKVHRLEQYNWITEEIERIRKVTQEWYKEKYGYIPYKEVEYY